MTFVIVGKSSRQRRGVTMAAGTDSAQIAAEIGCLVCRELSNLSHGRLQIEQRTPLRIERQQ